jgi:predicted ribosome quality control (RQC) complex YloA/Tae2 family protein
MALDGITISGLKKELNDTIAGGYITKIAQPEKDELLLTVKSGKNQYRLSISANPSLPLLYFTDKNKQAPMTAPNFCMLLRKHIGSGHITDIIQPSLERVLIFLIEHRNELGDICQKKLIVELMGKHSNIIFTDEKDMILDSIRHVSANMSSVREVLPGREYFIPQTQEKSDPFTITEEEFYSEIFSKNCALSKAIYTSLTGFSPMASEEICFRASVSGDAFAPECSDAVKAHIYHTFSRFMEEIKNADYHPAVYYENDKPIDFSVFKSYVYENSRQQAYSSVSELLRAFYSEKNVISRIRQKSTDLRKIVSTYLERNVKKLQLQKKQLKDTEKREKYKIYGELINTYGYDLEPGADKLKTINYYTGEEVTIPLDKTLTPLENAQRYFEKYNKQKRTYEAVTTQIQETTEDIEYLESVQNALEIATEEIDLVQISDELKETGFIKKRTQKKERRQNRSKPMHFLSSDGYHMFVGKNNIQNDELTFSTPMNRDWWFHSKGFPGSHVVVRSTDKEMPDSTFEEAGRLAAYFSKGKDSKKVEIDYTLRKNIKKPNAAKPGYVIYHTNYSMVSEADINGIQRLD